MNILILGSGGREHAIAWKLAQSNKLSKLLIAPGNAGTADLGQNISLSPMDFESIGNLCNQEDIDMVVAGPEEPLVKGIRDYFESKSFLKKILFVGPDAAGALLEGSKDFAKDFMNRHRIPTARHFTATRNSLGQGLEFLRTLNPPYVLKADGLAAGKGVLILHDLEEAASELKNILNGKFGEAGERVVIEEFLTGIELSVFVITDGKNYLLLPEAKDYKRIGEHDTGPNTGGMGSVSPVPFADEAFMEKVEEQIIKPTIQGLINEGIDYRGFVFFGLMNVGGNPYVIEYNCRMGDPETEAVFPRIKTDLVDILVACVNQTLDSMKLDIDSRTVVSVMLVSGGYPNEYKKGLNIRLGSPQNCLVFHAGTRRENDQLLTNGGRVMAISCYGHSIDQAKEKCMRTAEIIDFEGKYYRRDIGSDLSN
jgi:phosphoribosylamine---glycine ligase